MKTKTLLLVGVLFMSVSAGSATTINSAESPGSPTNMESGKSMLVAPESLMLPSTFATPDMFTMSPFTSFARNTSKTVTLGGWIEFVDPSLGHLLIVNGSGHQGGSCSLSGAAFTYRMIKGRNGIWEQEPRHIWVFKATSIGSVAPFGIYTDFLRPSW